MKEIKVPELAESLTEGTIAEWLKKEGDYIEKGEPIAELETDKVNVEINSEESGVISEFLFQPGDTVEVGQVIARLDEKGTAAVSSDTNETQDTKATTELKSEEKTEPVKQNTEQQPEASQEAKGKERKPIASPAARKRARELGIDLNEIPFQDPLGRIRTDDVEAYKNQSSIKNEETKTTPKPMATKQDDERVERIKMSRRRQTIAKRLVEAQQTAAMLTTFNEVDMTAILDLRNRRKDAFLKKNNVKLGFMSFFTKAVIGALKEFPLVNAEIQGNEILLKKFYDIGIAVSTEDGLVVPVVRNADSLSFAGIEREIGRLSEKARTNSLGLGDLTGGTFTITNGGIFGSLNSTPILNTPQVGILGMHKIQKRPVVVDEENDTVEVRPMMHLALSYDHRIIDGKEAVQFLVRVKQLLEDPEDLLLEG
ncbi:2-oxoglutarate dehydrogenase E2 component (dihydrolipoamide succinyltransferase) [Bacillus mesophilus]|uniref:Dihydrolipoyllysine-residue succinyltransferase component of 2-oxoglutarate dehydrogenase complex n=1 Tax=Bacillus mesophilus TaxID=1808955 RepID=A0A6M0QD04_9BACI|nr:2-oxoglutarate dehydrogenase complex dihydrolipoyllysine-residue succinyltransferase [Bacillus mesophilus]MBM7663463.1 2-oxoglutarate dehydrogenase E2 component (dihydrolipoamide succinyltransferase) [Bacillus mesophilus]NEY74186.1 2-oxoglutarate dehydrogenase complex dihydrolipoyllysine-residue succinyltransferase [Bacillus mesophilus]